MLTKEIAAFCLDFVSIQLISPASGNVINTLLFPPIILRFHSINIPSEWESLPPTQEKTVDVTAFPFN